MLALSRDLGISYKMHVHAGAQTPRSYGTEFKGRMIGGEGKEAEIDSAYFGGYVKPANERRPR